MFRWNSSPTSLRPAKSSSIACEAHMNREFLDLYNRELQLLNEQAREFAERISRHRGAARRHPRRSRRSLDRRSSGRRGLSCGAGPAQAQARISRNSPTICSSNSSRIILPRRRRSMLVKAIPTSATRHCAKGMRSHAVPISTPLFASSIASSPAVTGCAATSTIWPFELARRRVFQSPAPLQALGVSVGGEVLAGMRLTLTHRSAARPEDEPAGAARRSRSRSCCLPVAGPPTCRFISPVRRPMQSRFTSSCSPIAKGSIFDVSTSSAIRSSIRRPGLPAAGRI